MKFGQRVKVLILGLVGETFSLGVAIGAGCGLTGSLEFEALTTSAEVGC